MININKPRKSCRCEPFLRCESDSLSVADLVTIITLRVSCGKIFTVSSSCTDTWCRLWESTWARIFEQDGRIVYGKQTDWKRIEKANERFLEGKHLSLSFIHPFAILFLSVCYPFVVRLLSFCDLILFLSFLGFQLWMAPRHIRYFLIWHEILYKEVIYEWFNTHWWRE